jgi:hypothetical protein
LWGRGGPAVGRADVTDTPGHGRAASYPRYIWDGYEGCRSVRTFETRLRAPVESVFCDRPVTGRRARVFKTDIGRPPVDALTMVKKCLATVVKRN